MAAVLVQDPLHPYAARFLEILHERHGHKAVCFFTDRRAKARARTGGATLPPAAIEATYDVSLQDLDAFADEVRRRHQVVGVLPFMEPAVLPAAQLASRLGLRWNCLETVRRFRDKHALKEFLRTRHPEIRVNASQLVRSAEEVLSAPAPPYSRYVLKPNDGWGNVGIATFDRATPRDVVESFFRRCNRVHVMEEYVDGPEYFVNGQVDARGTVTVVAVFRYGRQPANGWPAIDHETRRVRHDEPTFGVLEAYVRRVVEALGLLRSPFHAEVRIDEQGPCLIEIAARLAGNGNAFVCSAQHGGKLDLFDVAAHYYVTEKDYGPIPLDWERYDATEVMYVHGVTSRRERVCEIRGVEEVERLPSFAGWVTRPPDVGSTVEPTVSSLSAPWCVLLASRPGLVQEGADAASGAAPPRLPRIPRPDLEADARAVRELLQINPRPPSVARRVLATAQAVRARAAFELGFALERALPPAAGAPLDLRGRSQELVDRATGAVVRRWQLGVHAARSAVGLRTGQRHAPGLVAPSRVAEANEVLRWLREYIAAPHPRLGRPGAICPFVQKAMNIDRLVLAFHDEIDGTSRSRLRAALLDEVAALKRTFPPDDPANAFASVVMVFPNLGADRFAELERLHDEMKTPVMQSLVMLSVFHDRSDKRAIHNHEFALYRSPLPCLAIRYMDVRDIAFVGTNRAAFEAYRKQFGPRYAAGEISNEFGYVDLFEAAQRRFPA
jgi:hypothetical protein